MPSLPQWVDAALRSMINDVYRGSDSYEVVKSIVIWVVALRVVRALRRIHQRQGLVRWIQSVALPYIRRIPMVRDRLAKEMGKAKKGMQESLLKDVTDRQVALPAKGRDAKELMALMEKRIELDTQTWRDGKITGSIYHGEPEHMDFIGKVYGMFAFTNPLHSSLHPSCRQMDAEVIQMVVNMYNGPSGACGVFTTGGTESILMAMKAYRDWGRSRGISEPNVIIPVTAHAAFDKAGMYFGIQMKQARTVPGTQEVDLAHVRRLIDRRTVALVGSAPQFPHGTVDPIEELGQLALKHGCGLHVDCCLGGFLVPFMEKAGFSIPRFDFRVPGVTSISCDPHKYGFAPKGASTVLFRTHELRHHMYCYVTEWTGGIYATAGILGSRPGGPVAGTWASMLKHGEAGYIESCRQIVGATRRMGKGVEAIEGIELLGRADVCVVSFTTTKESGLNIYNVADAMRKNRGWNLAAMQNPPAVHLAVTLPSAKNADAFVQDLKDTMQFMKSGGAKEFSGGTAGMYGQAQALPPSLIEESVALYLDTTMQATPAEE